MITGANSGIGLATVKLFAVNGARGLMAERRKKELDVTVFIVGGDVRGIQCYISQPTDLDCLFSIGRDEAVATNVLFANAWGGEFLPLESITEEPF